MHTNESAENYLETILILSKSHPVVRSVDVATELGFKKSSVSVAMKKLRESDQSPVWQSLKRFMRDIFSFPNGLKTWALTLR